MSEYHLADVPFEEWDAETLAKYLKTKNLGDYSELFMNNKITGATAPRLTEANLTEMGVTTVGDRIRLMDALSSLKKAQELGDREKILWQGQEQLFISSCEWCTGTACGCCPQDPKQYILKTNSLEIKTITPCRIGPIPCCCEGTYDIDNVDLSRITDADVQGVAPDCCHQTFCCAVTQEHVNLTSSTEGQKLLKLKKDEGQSVCRKIKNQVEVMQRMERS